MPYSQNFKSAEFRNPKIENSYVLDTADHSDDSLLGHIESWKSPGDLNFLNKIKSLISFLAYISSLSVEEINNSAEHAQQLPSAAVSDFLKYGIRGIDFPSLDQYERQKLEESDVIPHEMKSNVLNSIKKLLNEIIIKPKPPKNIDIYPVSCSRIRIEWEATDEDNLMIPVYKYLVQRSSKMLFAFLHMTDASRKAAESWQTVCEGLDTTCDDWIPADFTSSSALLLEYRISAWNALGSSDRVMLKISHLPIPWDRECPTVDKLLNPLIKIYLKKDVIVSLLTDPAPMLVLIVIGLLLLLLLLLARHLVLMLRTSANGNCDTIVYLMMFF